MLVRGHPTDITLHPQVNVAIDLLLRESSDVLKCQTDTNEWMTEALLSLRCWSLAQLEKRKLNYHTKATGSFYEHQALKLIFRKFSIRTDNILLKIKLKTGSLC